MEQLTQEHEDVRATLEARLEAAEERERASVTARAAERKRVAQALERARVQLLQMKNLQDKDATSGRELPGGVPVESAPSHQPVAVVA